MPCWVSLRRLLCQRVMDHLQQITAQLGQTGSCVPHHLAWSTVSLGTCAFMMVSKCSDRTYRQTLRCSSCWMLWSANPDLNLRTCHTNLASGSRPVAKSMMRLTARQEAPLNILNVFRNNQKVSNLSWKLAIIVSCSIILPYPARIGMSLYIDHSIS